MEVAVDASLTLSFVRGCCSTVGSTYPRSSPRCLDNYHACLGLTWIEGHLPVLGTMLASGCLISFQHLPSGPPATKSEPVMVFGWVEGETAAGFLKSRLHARGSFVESPWGAL